MFLNDLTNIQKLILSLCLDAIGMLTIFYFDLVWAPVAGYLMHKMYKGHRGKLAGIVVFIEELVPGLDSIPTFTIMWFLSYVFKGEK